MRGIGGMARIGNRRNGCKTCNKFAQDVMRLTRKRMLEEYPEEYRRLRVLVEIEQYPDVMEAFMKQYPIARPGYVEEVTEDESQP